MSRSALFLTLAIVTGTTGEALAQGPTFNLTTYMSGGQTFRYPQWTDDGNNKMTLSAVQGLYSPVANDVTLTDVTLVVNKRTGNLWTPVLDASQTNASKSDMDAMGNYAITAGDDSTPKYRFDTGSQVQFVFTFTVVNDKGVEHTETANFELTVNNVVVP